MRLPEPDPGQKKVLSPEGEQHVSVVINLGEDYTVFCITNTLYSSF